MDERTLRVLEYDKIKALLADRCACSLGRTRALAIAPSSDCQAIEKALRETTEARLAVDRLGRVPFGGLTDITDPVKRAGVGSTLEGQELNRVRDALRAGRLVAGYFAQHAEDLPTLGTRAAALREHLDLEEGINAALSDEGEVVDDASPELKRLRRRSRVLHEQILGKLDELMKAPSRARMLRERLPTMRSGRYCIPIKSQYQRQFEGIVHDKSDSAATVFLEPQAVVPLGNELREAELAAENEVLRILQELSGRVGERAEEILADLDTLGELDLAMARGRLSSDMAATAPQLDDEGYLALLGARHPLLPAEEVVPIDVWLGREFKTLLITGPNTGGKTVSLKTIGLLALMAQSGLHVPAEAGSQLPVFNQVFADIGDEQSIEQSLSTFSSHMSQIVHILRTMGRRVLVLLDEIGAGTDPAEGAALAKAILAVLTKRDARTVATTHHNDLKAFAFSHPEMENASVEFDPVTLQPTYHLRTGLPGASNAFDIAERLGLPKDIGARARQNVQQGLAATEELLRDVDRTKRELARERQAAEQARQELEEQTGRRAGELQRLASERQQVLRRAREQAVEIVREAEEHARRIIADLQSQPRQSKATEERLAELRELRREVEAQAQSDGPPSEPLADVRPGDLVRVRQLNRQGVALTHPTDGSVEVQVGRMRIQAPLTDLEAAEEFADEQLRDTAARLRLDKALQTSGELHLRGLTVDEGIVELEKYLDDAFLAGQQEIRIVHGKGTGALRQGIHQYLRSHPHVKSFATASHEDGGEGVTIVHL
ncbi:MAG: endonuclease MutS2 [Armatimonadota bacterium]